MTPHRAAPRADERHELPPDVEPEVAVAERAADPDDRLHPLAGPGGWSTISSRAASQ